MTVAMMVVASMVTGCAGAGGKTDLRTEKARIAQVISDSIGWAATKDKELVFRRFAEDDELFWFGPRDADTIHGRQAFVDLTENFFMLDDFKAVAFEIRDLRVNLSRSGDVAWYHARLDDDNEWKGRPANWEDVRWTGVLEKRNGLWVIVQMHFSSPTDANGEMKP